MGNVPVLKPSEIIAILTKLGFTEVRQRGSHKQFRDAAGRCTTVPFHQGRDISPIEATNISRHGFWLLLDAEELVPPFSEFPWFRDVAVGKILHVELPSSNHLYWPDLDIGLAVESIRHPERFPLVSQDAA